MQQLYLFRGNNALAIVDTNKKQIKLKKDGTAKKDCSGNKKRGRSSTVDHLEPEEMKKILGYFHDRGEWLHYMLLILQYNMARRAGDLLELKWENFYDPNTGKRRSHLKEIVEEKTGKMTSPRITDSCWDAIELYVEKVGCDPSKDGFQIYIATQFSRGYKGEVLSKSGYLKALKRAAAATGVQANVGTHSARKTFGAVCVRNNPSDPHRMEILQDIYNHSSAAITRRYIGMTDDMKNSYYDGVSKFLDDYILGDKVCESLSGDIVNITADDIRTVITEAYKLGMGNANDEDPSVHIEAITRLMSLVDSVKK